MFSSISLFRFRFNQKKKEKKKRKEKKEKKKKKNFSETCTFWTRRSDNILYLKKKKIFLKNEKKKIER